MKTKVLIGLMMLLIRVVSAQDYTNQSGLQTSVLSGLTANNAQPLRYKIAEVGFNSYHWQAGGIIIIELFEQYYGTGYEKYILENGFSQGINYGIPELKLVESYGKYHNGRITLGDYFDLGSTFGGYANKGLPIFFDVREYSYYKIKLTYMQDKIDQFSNINQIIVYQSSQGTNIPDFGSAPVSEDVVSAGNISISGAGNHYFNGNVGIGTKMPDEKLTVKGKIHAEEVRVDLAVPGPDYVFDKDYPLTPLTEIQTYIQENKHLPEVPSAKEMEEKGINLSEMNMLLLKKIEELTLHLIEKDKEMKKLERSNRLLDQKFSSLENEVRKLKPYINK